MNGTMRSGPARPPAMDLESGADLYRAADQGGETPSGLAPEPAAWVELRFAGATDGVAVARLAALDEERELTGRVVVALLDGHAVAAVSLEDGRVVANPFVATADAVAMLRLRAEQLVGRPRHRRQRHWPRLRLA